MRTITNCFWAAVSCGALAAALVLPLGCVKTTPVADSEASMSQGTGGQEQEAMAPTETATTTTTTAPQSTPAAETMTAQPAAQPASPAAPELTAPAAASAATEPAQVESAAVPAAAETAAAMTAMAMKVTVPNGLPELPVPADNPMTAEKVELGAMLYFDTRLSADGTVACATCHDPKMGWTERRATSAGINGQVGDRNSPTVINAAYADAQFWDGRAASLEEQALGPMENPIEMGHKLPALVEQLNGIAAYKERFQKVFGTDVNPEGIAKAIAAFERTVLSGDSPYDKFQAGDKTALNEAQQRGMTLFMDSGCASCHEPPLFSNYGYYNVGVGSDGPNPVEGRKKVTGKDTDMGKIRVPALREIANTGPYFHDGSAATLEEAVAVMAAGGKDNKNLSPMMRSVAKKNLTPENQADLVEFLKALSGTYPIIEAPILP